MKRSWTSFFVVFTLLLGACATEETESAVSGDTSEAPQQRVTELVINDVVAGEGAEIKNGDTAVAHYTLWFHDANAEHGRGEMIQSSKERGTPIPFQISQGRVIEGWVQGIPGMKIGGTRELMVPSVLAYGDNGHPSGIPGDTDLVFEIEVVEIR